MVHVMLHKTFLLELFLILYTQKHIFLKNINLTVDLLIELITIITSLHTVQAFTFKYSKKYLTIKCINIKSNV